MIIIKITITIIIIEIISDCYSRRTSKLNIIIDVAIALLTDLRRPFAAVRRLIDCARNDVAVFRTISRGRRQTFFSKSVRGKRKNRRVRIKYNIII